MLNHNSMKKLVLIILPLFASCFSYAQNTFTNTGTNVGIGTVSPIFKLQVESTNAGVGRFSSSLTGTTSNIVIVNGSNYNYGVMGVIRGSGNPGDDVFGLGFTSNANADFNGVVNWTSSGFVGVGKTIPFGRLDVNGAILLPGSSNNSMLRPAIGTTRIVGEIAGYNSDNYMLNDGFLRLSAGGGYSGDVKSFIDLSGYSGVPDMNENIVLGTAGTERMRIASTGNVGIGTTDPGNYKLAVKGPMHTQSINVDMIGWSDYVFKSGYNLHSLQYVKSYIDKNGHLPDVPAEEQVKKDGIDLGEMDSKLLKKIEELTLYLIEKDKQLKDQQDQINTLGASVKQLLKSVKINENLKHNQ
jgi:hypothetical protein